MATRRDHMESASTSGAPPQPTVAISSTRQRVVDPSGAPQAADDSALVRVEPSGPAPMLASSCPGWICFAEKTHPEVIPNICTAKSPQQVRGLALKLQLAVCSLAAAPDLWCIDQADPGSETRSGSQTRVPRHRYAVL